MKFALVFAYDPTVTSPTEAEFADWMALDEEWRTAGITVHDAGFHSRDEARVVRVRDGATVVEKEPAAPAAYTVAGYWTVEAADIEAAADLAAKVPTAKYGYVEVRQVIELDD